MTYAKAIVPVVVGAILWVLSQVGATPDMSVKEVLTLAVTTALVWLTPNRK